MIACNPFPFLRSRPPCGGGAPLVHTEEPATVRAGPLNRPGATSFGRRTLCLDRLKRHRPPPPSLRGGAPTNWSNNLSKTLA